LVDSLDEAHLIAPVKAAAPVVPATTTAVRNDTPFRETQLVFANSPTTPVVDTDSDINSGYTVKLNSVAEKPGQFTVTVTAVNGTSKTWPMHDLEGKWSSLQGDGDPVLFRVAKVWLDFAMKDGGPVSLSDQPKNPAVLVQITGPSKLLPPPAPKPSAAPPLAPPMPKGLVMRVALAKEPGKIVYELEREGKIDARGVAALEMGGEGRGGFCPCGDDARHAGIYRAGDADDRGDAAAGASRAPGWGEWGERAGGVDSGRDVAGAFQREGFFERIGAGRFWAAGDSVDVLDHAGEI
jgi:hypothetical protein